MRQQHEGSMSAIVGEDGRLAIAFYDHIVLKGSIAVRGAIAGDDTFWLVK